MVERGEDLLRHVRELEEEVDLWKGLGMGAVAVGVDPETELGLLPGVLEAFVPEHPGVQVTVRSGHTDTLLPSLLQGELHFLVADAEIAIERDDLEIVPLAPQPIAAGVRPDHPLVRKRKPSPAEIATLPFVGASTAPRFDRWMSERGRQEAGKPFEPSLLCDNYEVLIRLAECSDAIVFGPRPLLARYERAGRLKVTSWPVEGPETQASLIRSKGRHISPAAERLATLFEAEDVKTRPRSPKSKNSGG
jgi:DNA-binding transcriptional LysR family regulator